MYECNMGQQHTACYNHNYILSIMKNVVTDAFQSVNVCVCDSCRERISVFPISCFTKFPLSVKITPIAGISWLSSSSFSSGVLGKPSSSEDCASGNVDSSSGGSVGVVISTLASLSGSLFSTRHNSTQSYKSKIVFKCRNIRNIEYYIFSCGNGKKFKEFKATVEVSLSTFTVLIRSIFFRFRN